MGKVQVRLNALGEHVKCNGNNVKVAGTFAVTKKRAFDSVCACHKCQLCGSNAGATVVVRMNTDNGSFAVFHITAEVFNLVCVSISGAHFHGGRQVKDNGVFFRRTHFFHNSFADSDGKINFRTGKAFRRIFIANVHTATGNFFFRQLADKFCTLHGNFRNTVHVFAKYNFALQRRGGVVEMDDYVFRTTYCFKSFTDKFFTCLHENLDGNIIGDVVAFNQSTQNFIFCFRSGREAHFDFFKTNIYQSMEEGKFFFNTHGGNKCLVTVTQVNATPDGCFSDSFFRPLTVGQFNRIKRNVFFRLFHKLSSKITLGIENRPN